MTRAGTGEAGRRGARLTVLLALGALTLLGSACASSGGDTARVLLAHDLAVRTDDGWTSAAAGDHLGEGSRLRTGTAEARLQLRDGQVWLGPGTRATLEADGVALDGGDLVVASDGSLAGRWDGVDVAGDGVFRLTSGVTPRLAVYGGAVTLTRPGERRELPQYREIGLASARLATSPDPLRYHAGDGWDRRLLPEAIAFDAEVSRLAAELDREHGTAPQPAGFYRSLGVVAEEAVPTLRAHARESQADGAFGPASEVLVTLAVAEAVTARHGLDRRQAVREVAELRALGARWGLVAVEHSLHTGDLAVLAGSRAVD